MRFPYTMYWDSAGHWQAGAAMTIIDMEGFRAGDYIPEQIRYRRTFYENDLLEYIAMNGPRGGVFVDVGANIGNHAVYFGKFLADYVVAIEPHPLVRPILQRNLQANGITRCSVVACAVGAEDGIGHMFLPDGYEANISASQVRFQPGDAGTNDDMRSVRVTTLDRALEEQEAAIGEAPITFLKMDIEGMELAALRGASRLLEQHRPQLALELATPEARSAVTAFLAPFGYHDVGYFGDPPTYHFIDPRVHRPRGSQEWTSRHIMVDHEMRRRELAIKEIMALVPPGDSFILIDEDEWGRGSVPHRHAVPFLERDGQYWGPPADDGTAILEFERLRRSGASYVVFVWPAFWWIEHYAGLYRHVQSTCRCLVENDRLVVFELRSTDIVGGIQPQE